MSVVASGLAAPAMAAQHVHDERPISGPLANATVSFGAWSSDPPLDRFPNVSPPGRNIHKLIPFEANVRAGGSVNFIIAGFHHVLVYGPGIKKLEEINSGLTIPLPGAPDGFPQVIDDPVHRVYRGLSPFGLPVDRNEVIHFPKKGRFLVVCGFLPHFNDRMFGFVRVWP